MTLEAAETHGELEEEDSELSMQSSDEKELNKVHSGVIDEKSAAIHLIGSMCAAIPEIFA